MTKIPFLKKKWTQVNMLKFALVLLVELAFDLTVTLRAFLLRSAWLKDLEAPSFLLWRHFRSQMRILPLFVLDLLVRFRWYLIFKDLLIIYTSPHLSAQSRHEVYLCLGPNRRKWPCEFQKSVKRVQCKVKNEVKIRKILKPTIHTDNCPF